jgi:LysW-gamma-L-lysine carboxypeptidase
VTVDAVELLTEMVACESLTGSEGDLAQLLVERMTALGLDAHVDEAGNAVGVLNAQPAMDAIAGGTGADASTPREIVLLGHMDTVPGKVPQRVEDGKLWGRGSVDAKGPLATFVMAVAGLEPAPHTTITVVGAVEEECATSKGAHWRADKHRPEACIIGEPSGFDAVTLGYKGRLLFSYRDTQPCGHSAGPQGAVAERAVAFWNAMKTWSDAFNEGKDALFAQLMPSLQSLRTITDGLHETVEATIGFRLPPDFDVAALERHAREHAGTATLEPYGHEVAWSSARTTPLARAFQRAFAKHGLPPRSKHKTGTSDMNVLGPVWKCPIVAYGPGDSLLDHTPDEHIVLAEYLRAIDILRDVLVDGGWAVHATS